MNARTRSSSQRPIRCSRSWAALRTVKCIRATVDPSGSTAPSGTRRSGSTSTERLSRKQGGQAAAFPPVSFLLCSAAKEAVVQRSAGYICAALLVLGLTTAARADEPYWLGTFVNDEQSDAGVQKAIETAV